MDRFQMITKFFHIILISIILLFVSLVVIKCTKIERIVNTKIIRDTIYIEVVDSTLAEENLILYNKIDSLENIINVYDEELTIAFVKLERIKDYNAIAAKGNNIKYLRGWINRVFDE